MSHPSQIPPHCGLILSLHVKPLKKYVPIEKIAKMQNLHGKQKKIISFMSSKIKNKFNLRFIPIEL